MDYIIAAKFTHPIQRLIASDNNWIILDNGVEICEQMYQSDCWQKPRRLVIVRQKISERPKATGKQLKLFLEEEVLKTIGILLMLQIPNIPQQRYGGYTEEELMLKIELKN